MEPSMLPIFLGETHKQNTSKSVSKEIGLRNASLINHFGWVAGSISASQNRES